jgi:hypothetical protein
MSRYKNKILLFTFLILIVGLAIYQSNYIYHFFHQKYLPVFDGVMYEKTQILRYLSFNGNFSNLEKLNQIIYEFIGNPVSGGYNSFLIFLNPNFLINDYDVVIKSFVSLLLIYYSIIWFFNLKFSKKTIIIFILLSQVPIFFHFRIGLSSYVPDLTSSMLLLSSYLLVLNYIKKKKILFLSLAVSSVSLAIFSRFNFFVYTGIIYVPLIPLFFSSVKSINLKSLKICTNLIFILTIVFFTLFYIYYHFNDFISYYSKPANYAVVTIDTSLKSVFNYFYEELGLNVLTILLCLIFITNKIYQESSYNFLKFHNFYLLSPFVFLFVFLVFIMKATNQPHVFSLLVMFLIPVGFLRINIKPNKAIVFIVLFGFTILSIHKFYIKYEMIKTNQIDSNTILLAKKIDEYTSNKKKSYFILFDTSQEIPLDIYFFKKYKIHNNNKLKFYFTDWDYYEIDQTLNLKSILSFYYSEIKRDKPKLVFINNYELKLGRDRRLAEQINQSLRKFVEQSNLYYFVEEILIKNKPIKVFKLNEKN